MATYDSPRATVETNLESTVGNFLSAKILAALEANGDAGGDVTINQGWTPGSTVAPGTDILIAAPGSVSGEIDIPAGVSALLLTGPTGVQATFNVTGDVGVALTEAKDIISISMPTDNPDTPENEAAVEATFDGGNGFDIGRVEGSIEDYTVVFANGVLTLTNEAGGVITMNDLEYVQFADGSVVMNLNTVNDVASATLYEVILGRSADEGGIEYFSGAPSTEDLLSTADFMLHSEEFTAQFGDVDSLSDEQFLDIMYQGAFGRDADEGGEAYWLAQLAGGMSKAEVALNFAVSNEADVTFDNLINLNQTPTVGNA
ncbi:DUF4214 domain-containing protein [Tianweitania sediminis]|uniref:DUF4214 domain-containing protein n=1 Tax=Tianweitania sediminis TaxID=1502156 RepID=A0A8J7R1M2_9HYPH|nr:DUF4214 domain-containing protein [Tianweitania sediminis]MBP0438511.1 DUF4214 domain-containing protein [Tianweitania sediminis]HEV7417270.1 DUF4214 domain-containing protein [Tianweitania sediminis]